MHVLSTNFKWNTVILLSPLYRPLATLLCEISAWAIRESISVNHNTTPKNLQLTNSALVYLIYVTFYTHFVLSPETGVMIKCNVAWLCELPGSSDWESVLRSSKHHMTCNAKGCGYLAVSQWEVGGASQWRKGTLCSLIWMSYRPYK